MNVDEFKHRFLNNYKELEQLSISSMTDLGGEEWARL